MLATLADDAFSSPDWIYERKLDGVRCLVFRHGDRVRLMSRNRRKMNDTYPELVSAVEEQEVDDFVADGEIVAFEGARTSFSRLQKRIGITDAAEARESNVAVYLYLFDLLHLAGHDTMGLAQRDRKGVLKGALRFRGRLRYTPHRTEHGERYLREACRKGWEGIMAKRANAEYRHRRTSDWLKFKCTRRQEFVIGGYTEPQGSRVGFGALLIGYHDGGELHCAGKVGTGYDDDLLRRLSKKLKSIERKTSPFADDERSGSVHWVTPKLVGEVAFTEWTDDGRLRHPRFLGLREDKDPEDVVRERPS
jgi:bifunctional non-homologous end joining protein LigD